MLLCLLEIRNIQTTKGGIEMPDFVSLKASGLSAAFDAEVHTEQPVVTVEEKEDRIEVSFIFAGFTISDDDQEVEGKLVPFKEVGISGAGFVSESGRPLLPSFGRFVQIPPGCDFDVSVKRGRPVKFEDVLITPAQEEAVDGAEVEFEFDVEAYSEDELYPEEIVEVSGPQEMDDYNVLLIHVRPLQYNPAKKLLRGYSNITVVITLSRKEEVDEEETVRYPFPDPATNLEGFGNLILNPRRRIFERVTGITPPRVVFPAIQPRGPEFLIIYDENLKKPAETLDEWKNRRGLITETVSIKKVGNTVAKIKDYIRKRRRILFSRLRYVLLFGDIGNIVTEETGGNTTDHYYYTSKDPTSSSECLLPWVSGGRIPVGTVEEGMAVVNQIIRYERRPPCDPENYRRMTFAAYFQDDAPQDGRANRAYMKTMEGIRSDMITQGFDVERVYVSNNPNPVLYKDGMSVPQEVKDAIVDGDTATDMLISEISEGQLVVGHRDHGNRNGWAHPPLQMNHIEAILSQYPSTFYSINCLTGKFDANPVDCFAEALLELDGGAPSLIAATELSGTWRNDSMMKALFDAMWSGVISTFPATTASYAVKYNRLGDILNYAKAYLLVAHGSNAGVKDHFEIYHVIGDPTLQLWVDEPLSIRLRVRILENTLYVNTNTCPRGSSLTIWHRDKLLKRMEPSSTRVTVRLRDLKLLPGPAPQPVPMRRTLSVCFSAPRYRFAQASLKF
jgi:hypothetical protein